MAYTEKQVEQFCGLHAFNMLFQERKLVWIEGGPEYVLASGMGDVDASYEEYVEARHAFMTAQAHRDEKEREIRKLRAAKPDTEELKAEAAATLKAANAELKDLRAAEETAEGAKDDALTMMQEDAETASHPALEFQRSGVALNMAVKCEEISDNLEAANIYNVELRCTAEDLGLDGQIPVQILNDLAEELHYGARVVYPADWEAQFDARTADPNFIGIIVNYVHPTLFRHYGAVVKYGGGVVGQYGYADSAGVDGEEDTLITYSDLAGVRARLEELHAQEGLNALIFISATAESAPTVALARLRAAAAPNAAVGGRRKTRRLRKAKHRRYTRR